LKVHQMKEEKKARVVRTKKISSERSKHLAAVGFAVFNTHYCAPSPQNRKASRLQKFGRVRED
jgi:hypothetical protein